MAAITSAGIGSGLDVNGIVSQLVAVEKHPLQALQKKASTFQTQISVYGQIQSQISAFSDAATKLGSALQWNQAQVTSSDATAVSATTSTGTPQAGTYQVQTQHLATAQSVASVALTTGQPVGAGTLVIQPGSWNTAGDLFTPAGAPVTLTVVDGANTPADIASQINAANAGVTASTVTDSAGTRLVLTGSATGQASGFTVAATETGAASPGLANLSFPASGGGALQRTQAATDARFTINGVALTSPTNKLDGTLAGLSLTLNKETTSAVAVTVAPDTAARQTLVNNLVTTYNALNKTLSANTAYDAGTKVAGSLQGDSAAVSIQSALRTALRGTLPSGTYLSLADVGLTQGRDGSLSVDATKLASAMANGAELGKLFNVAGTAGVSDGLATRIASLATGMTSVGGSLNNRTTALQQSVKRNSDDQQKLNDRVSQYESRMRAQYSALDTKMASMNALSSYVTQQVAAWTKTNSN